MAVRFRLIMFCFLAGLFCLGMLELPGLTPAAAQESAAVAELEDEASEVEAADEGEVDEPESSPTRILRLGPLPAIQIEGIEGELAPDAVLVPEFDVLRTRPSAGDALLLRPGRPVIWREVLAPPPTPAETGVFWFATYPRFEHYGEYEIEVEAPGRLALYLDGELLAEREAELEDDLEHRLTLRRGRSCLLVRIELTEDDPAGEIELEIEGEHAASIDWSMGSRFAPARFDQTRGVAWYSSVAVAPMGKSMARRLSRRDAEGDGITGQIQVLSRSSTVRATLLEGDSGTPLFFTPRGHELVLRRGDDVVLWPMPQGVPRVLVREEKGLSVVETSPDASFFLLVSRRGAEIADPDENAILHQTQLRASVPDYLPGDCIHLVETRTGARRQLTLPGDHLIDDAIFLPQHGSVLYSRVLPQSQRPWFRSEIRRIALDTGEQSLVAEFVAGWEVRPDDLCVSPDGLRVAFTGPPDQIGSGQEEHNVYNRALWILDLITGEYQRVITEEGWSYNAAHDMGFLSWLDDQTLIAVVDAGSGHKIVRVLEGADGWTHRILEYEGESLGAIALSPDKNVLVYSAESRDRPANLRLMDLRQAREVPVEDPNADLPWLVASPRDASFKGPGGETIEAWWFAPTAHVSPAPRSDGGEAEEPDGKDAASLAEVKGFPLIVYYYGGASPTQSGFNTTFQWIAANGYALLVIQPRGAYGWGDAFADHHAGDWGPKAGGDVLAGVKQFLADHPEIDGKRVGIYGGSYGGFLTNWLVSESQDFAAAVSYYGISDLGTYWGDGEWGWTYGDMSVAGRYPFEQREYFLEHSPWRNADKIETPLLLMHGLADKNVRPEESIQLFTALKVQDKPVEMVLFPGEGHGISGTFTVRTTQRDMMMDWFDGYLRDEDAAWSARWWEDE